MNNRFLLAFSTLVGTIVGAGIFGLPYAISKSGIIPGLFYFIVLGGVVLLLHLMFGEIALRTQGKHRLIGYASIYLGVWAKRIVTISTIVGIGGALLAYIIIAGDFLQLILFSFLPFSNFAYSLLFWAFFSLFILWGIQAIAKTEFFLSLALFLVIFGVFLFALPKVQLGNFSLFEASRVFLPYGVVLFAFAGWVAIPEIAELFKNRKEKRNLDNLIVWALLLCGGLYALFVFFVVGVSGVHTSQDALSGLAPFLGNRVVSLGALFGMIALATSFLVLGNYLKNSLRHDYKLPNLAAVGIAIGVPLLLFLLGFREFIAVIATAGALMGALEGAVIVLIYQKAKQKSDRNPEYELHIPRFLLPLLVGMLILGALAEILM